MDAIIPDKKDAKIIIIYLKKILIPAKIIAMPKIFFKSLAEIFFKSHAPTKAPIMPKGINFNAKFMSKSVELA